MYCKNCGIKLKIDDRYCTSCGYDNYNISHTTNVKKNDKASVWLIILCVLFPFVGLILYLSFKDTEPRKAKSYGKSSLISFIVGLILVIIMVVFAVFAFVYVADGFGDSWDEVYEIIDEDYYEDDINYFTYAIDKYAKYASGNFYKDLYLDNTIVEKCYDIDDLEDSIYYDGSVMVKYVDGEINITVWLTDFEYYVAGIDYETYVMDDIKKGNKIERSCSSDGLNNSL